MSYSWLNICPIFQVCLYSAAEVLQNNWHFQPLGNNMTCGVKYLTSSPTPPQSCFKNQSLWWFSKKNVLLCWTIHGRALFSMRDWWTTTQKGEQIYHLIPAGGHAKKTPWYTEWHHYFITSLYARVCIGGKKGDFLQKQVKNMRHHTINARKTEHW